MQVTVQLTPAELRHAFALNRRHAAPRWWALNLASLLVLFLVPLPTLLRYSGVAPAGMVALAVLKNPFLWLLLCFNLYIAPPLAVWRACRAMEKSGRLSNRQRVLVHRIDEEGVTVFEDGRRVSAFIYGTASWCARDAHMLLLGSKDRLSLVLPLRCFACPQQADTAERLMRRGVQDPLIAFAVLHSRPEPCLYRFSFEAVPALITSGLALLAPKPRRLALYPIFWFYLCFITLFAGRTLRRAALPSAVAPILFGALVLGLLAAGLLRRPKPRAAQVPAWLLGPTTIEVGIDGVRCYNSCTDSFFPWTEVTGAVGGQGLSAIHRRRALIAALPTAAAPFAAISQALDYVHTHAADRARRG